MAISGLEVSDFISILALCVAGGSSAFTAFTFLKTYSRNRKSEQIKIARELADKINTGSKNEADFRAKNAYPDEGSIEDKSKWISDELSILYYVITPVSYFTYLVEQKEIDDKSVLNYYKKWIPDILNTLEALYPFVEGKMKIDTGLRKKIENHFGTSLSSALVEFRRDILQFKKVWEQK